MRYFGFLSFFLILTINTRAQTQSNCDCYDRLTNLSRYYEEYGDTESALKAYSKGLNFKPKAKWSPYEYYRFGELHAIDGDIQSATHYLAEAFRRGFDTSYFSYEVFDEVRESQGWHQVAQNLDSMKREFQAQINFDYRLAIEDIRGSDQTIRRLIKVPDSTFRLLDSINYSRLKSLFKQYGYPDMQEHGFEGSQGAYLILLHAAMYTQEMYEEILDILNQAINAYGYKRSDMAQFIDRREVWHNKREQIFGTWNAYRADNFSKIRELKAIDEKRMSYNLLRLKEQAIIESRNIPVGYVASAYPDNYFCGHTLQD